MKCLPSCFCTRKESSKYSLVLQSTFNLYENMLFVYTLRVLVLEGISTGQRGRRKIIARSSGINWRVYFGMAQSCMASLTVTVSAVQLLFSSKKCEFLETYRLKICYGVLLYHNSIIVFGSCWTLQENLYSFIVEQSTYSKYYKICRALLIMSVWLTF